MKMKPIVCLAALALSCSLLTAKEPPLHQRGWIGGEFRVVTAFPAAFTNPPRAALLITGLNTNTPASLAGLEAGDLILEVKHQPASRLRTVRATIDQAKPGALLPVKIWHDGNIVEREIRVGRETYNDAGVFMVGLPGFFYAPKIWPFSVPHAGLSIVAAGFKPEPESDRKELSSAEQRYFKSCNPKSFEVTDAGWKAWLVIMQAETCKRIRSQEIVPAANAVSPPAGKQQAFGYLSH